MEFFEVPDVLELLRREIDRVGGQSELARRSGVSRTQINRALNGRRLPASQLCRALGLEWGIVRYIVGEGGPLQPVIIENRDFLLVLKAEIEKVGSITAWCDQIGVRRLEVARAAGMAYAPRGRPSGDNDATLGFLP
jgi:transcriptional regulator with XRE-family HTH domain